MGRHCSRSVCPFCGWPYTDMIPEPSPQRGDRDRITFRVRCCACYALGPEGETRAEASKLWDARTPIRLDRHGEEPALGDPRGMLKCP